MSISDRLALEDLVYDYADSLDRRDVPAFVALFTPDAHLGVYAPESDDPVADYKGRRIADAVSLVTVYRQTMHVVSNPRFKLAGSNATGVVYCLAHHITDYDDRPHDLVMMIRYFDRYRNTANGWRFEDRRITRYWDEIRPLVESPPLS